jgi:hypothetical protein
MAVSCFAVSASFALSEEFKMVNYFFTATKFKECYRLFWTIGIAKNIATNSTLARFPETFDDGEDEELRTTC